jgi:xanthine dehydrogenase accessory factor
VHAADGNARHVLEAAAAACGEADAVLALVVETEGSTYVDAGAMALFGAAAGQAGWLSGGCLEPEIERRAADTARVTRIEWLEIDTRDDEDLLSGSALGCRGRLRIALLPLRALPGLDAVLDVWRQGRVALEWELRGDGHVAATAAAASREWRPDAARPQWHTDADAWRLRILPPPEALLFGAGPEAPLLLPLLRDLGWRTTLAERRPRWRTLATLADRHLDATPSDAARAAHANAAVLVMHHNFELDREALAALAPTEVAFIGLLGPVRRREDLFRVLPGATREALLPRLRSPIGLKLGGRGSEAIALSIAAQLQTWRSGEESPPGVAG